MVCWPAQTQENQHSEYRDEGYDNHRRPRSSGAGFTRRRQSALARRRLETRNYEEQLQPRDHSAWKPRPRKWDKGYIRIGTLVRYFWFSHSEVGDIFEGVVEAVGEIRGADDQGQLDDLSLVVKPAQFQKRGSTDAGGAARYAVGVEDGGLFFFIEEGAARIKRQRRDLLRGDAGALC